MSHHEQTSRGRRAGLDAGACTLWASAFIIMAMIVVQAGRTTGPAAYGQSQAKAKGLSLATLQNVADEDLLAVVDDSTSSVFIYRVAPNREVDLLTVRSLEAVFGN